MIISLSQADTDKCWKFANDVVSTNVDKYRERNQTDVAKIIDDIYVGKMAEYAAYRLLAGKGKNVQEPDCQVYGAGRKSFSADLTDGDYKYHVKCMMRASAERFGLSWSFQCEDHLVSRPTDKDVLILCQFDAGKIDIKTVIKAEKVVNIYTNPVLRKLWGIKKVLMWDDVYDLQVTK